MRQVQWKRRRWAVGLWAVGLLVGASVVYGQGGMWSSTDSMDTPRDAHAALVVNGKVLVIGGRTSTAGGTTRWTDYYDPALEVFVPTGDMVGSRSFFPAVLLDNGKVLAAGGFRSGAGTIRAAELFNPATGTWATTGSMRSARELHTGTKLTNGKVLMAGGFSNGFILRSAELYNPSTGAFGSTGSMRSTRFGHTATLLTVGSNAGKVLVTGGRTSNNVSHKTTEFYNPSNGKWSNGPSMNHDRYRHTATTLADGRLLISGGYSSTQGNTLASAEIYDPTTNTFTLLTSTMSDTRMDHTATLLSDGRVLIVGGWSSVKGSTVASADIFDPMTNSFTPTAPLPISRHEHTATLLPDGTGRVLVAGGLQWEPTIQQTLNDAYLYAP